MTTRNRSLLALLAALSLTCWMGACDNAEEYRDDCPGGDVIQYQQESFCIVIEEGFLSEECPAEYPFRNEVDGVVVCSDSEELPEGLDAELERRGYKNNQNNGENNGNNGENNGNNGENNGENNGDVCQELDDRYVEALEPLQGCQVDADCGTYQGPCGTPSGCHAPIHVNADTSMLDAVVEEFNSSECVIFECMCDQARPVACVENSCVFAEVQSCLGIDEQYEALVEDHRACEADADCQVLNGQCGVGLGGCYEPVNLDLSQEALSALGAQFSQGGCTDGVCDCDVAPGIACVENLCTFTQAPPVEDACLDLQVQYDELVQPQDSKACEVDADCQVLNGQCGVGLGGCYEVVNQSVSQGSLSALGDLYQDANCTGAVCDCAEPPAAACEEGLCVPREEEPEGCTQDDPQVCGTDGQTYPNRCEAQDAGQVVMAEGACRYCNAENPCGDGEVCYSLDGLCGNGAFAGGVCGQAQIEGCQDTPERVCGCDGEFYTSSCAALAAGAGVSRFGGCQEEGSNQYACYDQTCGPLQACSIAANDVAGEGQPDFFAGCVDLTGPCSNQPSCELCYPDLDDFNSCSDGTGHIILYSPGG